MINLYSEIKNFVVRIKTLLTKNLESILQNPKLNLNEENDAKLIIQYLLTLGEEKSHLKSVFLKMKTSNLKKSMAQITKEPKQSEVSFDVY